MFILVTTESLRLLMVRRRNSSPALPAPGARAALLPSVSPIDSVVVDASAGTRYQLLRALRAMAAGERMVVKHKISDVGEFIENPGGREAWFRSLRTTASWQGQDDVEPLQVPGTAYPSVIGWILIRAGWCAPSDQPHWVPNLRFFLLTELGVETFRMAQAWWSDLSTLERARVMILE